MSLIRMCCSFFGKTVPCFRLPCLLLLLSLLGACSSFRSKGASASASGPALIKESSVPYFMAPLDTAEVRISGGEVTLLQVDLEGNLLMKGTSHRVQGMAVEDFRALLLRTYGNSAAIEITEFRPNRVTILGEVFHQIHAQLDDGPMRVMDAIASANGFTPLANKRRVRLLRQNAGQIKVYELDMREMMRGQELSQNVLLKPGDIVTVPRNFL